MNKISRTLGLYGSTLFILACSGNDSSGNEAGAAGQGGASGSEAGAAGQAIEFILIEGGRFQMDDEVTTPIHAVTVRK